jgi:hypothetical protein
MAADLAIRKSTEPNLLHRETRGAENTVCEDPDREAADWVRRRFRKHTSEDVHVRVVRNRHVFVKHGIIGIGWRVGPWHEIPLLAVWVDASVTNGHLGPAWELLCQVTDTVCEMDVRRSPDAGIEWWWPRRPETRAVLAALLEDKKSTFLAAIARRAQELGLKVTDARVRRILGALTNLGLVQYSDGCVLWLRYAIWISAGQMLRRLVDRGLPVGIYSGGRRENEDPALVADLWMFAVVADGTPDSDLAPGVLSALAQGLPCTFRIDAMRLSDFQRERRLPGTRAYLASNDGVALLGTIPEACPSPSPGETP